MADTCRRLRVVLIAVLAFGALTATAEARKSKSKPVSVFPAPKTPVASDQTTFSFRGLKPKNLGPVRVYGSQSGRHGGKRLAHSDHKGVSFIPKGRFTPGETVKVYTHKRIKRTNKGDFYVKIGRFYGDDDKQAGPGTPLPKDGLKSRPDLKPPTVNVVTNTPQAAPGKVFFAPKEDGLTIADDAGRISWFRPIGFGNAGNQVYNFQPKEYNGRPVLTYWKGASSATGFSQVGNYEILNDRYNRIARFEPGNGYGANIHEFDLTPRGTAIVLAYRGVTWDLRKVGGASNGKVLDNVVQEVDIKTGAVLFEWHALGNVGIRASEGAMPTDGSPWDYIHINAAKPDGNSVLVSGRRMSTIYRVDRKTARVRWRLRGDGLKPKTNSFKLGPGAAFGYQHDIERLPNGDISLFDNSSDRPPAGLPAVNEESSALILRLSGKGGRKRASLVKRYTHGPDPIVSRAQGSARPLENGNWFVGWGDVSQMTEFTPDGKVAFDADVPDVKKSSYRAFKAPWQGKPKDRPAIASEADGAGARVYASWNGATEIGKWKVLTGSGANDLTEAGSAPWKGLETEIDIPTVGSKVQVVAYDKEGKMLKKSGLTELGAQSR